MFPQLNDAYYIDNDNDILKLMDYYWAHQGTIPTVLGLLLSLKSIYLGYNLLYSTIPTESGRLVNLR